MNKYHYRHPRPDAAITELIDMDWRPVLTTPPHPEYPSGHSTFSAAAATVLEAFNRGRLKQIEVVSEDVPDEVRRFSSFFEAAAEAGRSRIFGGIHFEESNAAGQMLGREVALRVLSSHFVEE
jgi:membrane-associated phospholipid phosphatase